MDDTRANLVTELDGIEIKKSVRKSILTAFDQLVESYPDKSGEISYKLSMKKGFLHFNVINFCGEISEFELKFQVDDSAGNNIIGNIFTTGTLNIIETFSWICLLVILLLSYFVFN